MAKAATADPPGMDKADIKRHMRFARSEPVTVAFALAKDGTPILQFDRHKPGRALEKQLKDAAPDSKSHRFGTVVVDPNDEKLALFTVNRPGGGLARKLVIALKGTGFSKVKIVLDDGTEVEGHQEADEEQEAAELGAKAGTAAAEATAAPPIEAAAPPPATQRPAAAQPTAAQPTVADLQTELTGLVKRMLVVIARDPSQKAALAELAIDTRASLKRPDLTEASAAIDVFREAIGDAEQAPAQSQAPPQSPSQPTPVHPAATEHHDPATAHPAAKEHHDPPANGPDLRKEGEAILATLTNAVKQAMPMLSLVPGLGELIKTIVPAVQSAIKAGQIEQARASMDALIKAIMKGNQASPGVAAHPGEGMGGLAASAAQSAAHQQHREHAAKHAPAISKAGTVWDATLQKIMSEVGKLEKSFAAAITGHGMAAGLAKSLRGRIDASLPQLDDRLVHVLTAVNKAADAAERAKHVEHAHKLVQHYQQHVAQDPVIKMLDRNPFSPMAIEKTVMASLAALEKGIR